MVRSRVVYKSRKHYQPPSCLFGGKGKSENDNEESAWKALEKAMGGLKKELSVQDILREQMKEKEFSGGGFGGPPGDNGDGSGGSEEDDFASMLDELLQVVLATIGLVFVYIYMIRGDEMIRLAKDYIIYLCGGTASPRLKQAMYGCASLYEGMTRRKVVREDWLERAIVCTPTWWHNPRQLARLVGEKD